MFVSCIFNYSAQIAKCFFLFVSAPANASCDLSSLTLPLDYSTYELVFGEYLGAYSENEYTNAGEVMQSTGKVLQAEARARSVSMLLEAGSVGVVLLSGLIVGRTAA